MLAGKAYLESSASRAWAEQVLLGSSWVTDLTIEGTESWGLSKGSWPHPPPLPLDSSPLLPRAARETVIPFCWNHVFWSYLACLTPASSRGGCGNHTLEENSNFRWGRSQEACIFFWGDVFISGRRGPNGTRSRRPALQPGHPLLCFRLQPGLAPAGVPHLQSSLNTALSKAKRTLPLLMKALLWSPLPDQRFSKWGSQTSCSIVQELVRKADSWLHPRPTDSGGGTQKSVFINLLPPPQVILMLVEGGEPLP